MRHPSGLHRLVPFLVVAACVQDHPPTAPGSDRSQRPVAAATLVVNSTADPGDGVCNARQCTLREAIKVSGTTQVSFAAALSGGTITLARPGAGGGTLAIEKSLSITGPSAGITIQRRSTDPSFRIVRIPTGVTVQLTRLTLRNGKTDLGGGGISNFGTLTVDRSTITGNSALRNAGGIDNHSRLTVTNSFVSRNSGGGIFNCARCSLRVTRSTIADNSGRGVTTAFGSSLMMANSLVARNSRAGILTSNGTSTISHTRIVENSTGILAGGEGNRVTLTHSTVARNSGAGISNTAGEFTVSHSAIVGNSGQEGGGISNTAFGYGRVTTILNLINSTVAGNTAASGGGIFNASFVDEAEARLVITNSTIAGNSASGQGGGIDFRVGRLTLVNSLIAQNAASAAPDVRVGTEEGFVLTRFNLIGDGTGSGISNTDGNQVGSASAPIDPKIGPLAENGGPTRTRALLDGSPAIDAASDADCPATDQRDVSRPQGAGCDIGSYERE